MVPIETQNLGACPARFPKGGLREGFSNSNSSGKGEEREQRSLEKGLMKNSMVSSKLL